MSTPTLLLVIGLAVLALVELVALVTVSVLLAALGDAADVIETREAELKGLAGSHRLHLVGWAPAGA